MDMRGLERFLLTLIPMLNAGNGLFGICRGGIFIGSQRTEASNSMP